MGFSHIHAVKDNKEIEKEVVFNHTLHKEMWDWVANNPGESNKYWPKITNSSKLNYPYGGCYACDTSIHVQKQYNLYGTTCCTCCPFGDFSNASCLNELHNRWSATLECLQYFQVYYEVQKRKCDPHISSFEIVLERIVSDLKELSSSIRDYQLSEEQIKKYNIKVI